MIFRKSRDRDEIEFGGKGQRRRRRSRKYKTFLSNVIDNMCLFGKLF